MRYHLNINGETSGPFSQFAVIERIREGSVPPDALVWRQGFDEWHRADAVEEFADYWPKAEVVAEEDVTTDPNEIRPNENFEAANRTYANIQNILNAVDDANMQPRPWLRFWARMIDYMAYIGIVMFGFMLFLPEEKAMKLLASRQFPLESLLILGFVPIEAWFLSRFGKTPGRALLRMEVFLEHNGQKLNYRQALIRALQVYVKGVGLWLPFVSLITMTWSRIYLLRNGRTSWDENCGTLVISRPMERWRMMILILLALLLVSMIAIGLNVRPEVMQSLQMQNTSQG